MDIFHGNTTLGELLIMAQQIEKDNKDFEYAVALENAILMIRIYLGDKIKDDTSVEELINLDISTLEIHNFRHERTLENLIKLLKERKGAQKIEDVKESLLHASSGIMNDLECGAPVIPSRWIDCLKD